MKTLILILSLGLATAGLFGQGGIIFNGDTIYFNNQSDIWEDPYITSPRFKPAEIELVSIDLLVEYWVEYKQECYNDSILEYEYMIEYWNGQRFDTIYSKTIQRMPESYITQMPKVYRHKEPTFEGFMNYLERKTK